MLINSTDPVQQEPLTISALSPYISIIKNYCSVKNCNINIYRSIDLREISQQAFPESCHSLYSETMLEYIEKLHSKRLLVCSEAGVHTNYEIVNYERFLIVNWRESLFDGACYPISNHYIDYDCMPGWD